ncbi:HlyD family efflux transporter periplasmic adaptor subunit, partial [Patescibacteria group bacterium]|nr:HlyD family efflux transporter periplasmic adaptor subunit [Patescibacteria group bacterium]
MLSKLFKQIIRRKFITGMVLLVIASGAYAYQGLTERTTAVEYITATAERSIFISSISGSGQVSVSNQTDIKPKVSGDIVWVGVKIGQEVQWGQVILRLDDTDEKKAVADAEIDLEEVKLKFDKDLAQAPIDYERKLESLKKAEDNLEKEYEDTFNAISNAFLDLPVIMIGLNDLIFSSDFPGSNQWNIDYYTGVSRYDSKILQYRQDVYDDYNIARTKYDENLRGYKVATRYSDVSSIETLINETYETTKAIAEAVKTLKNLVDFYEDILTQRSLTINSLVSIHQSSLKSYIGTTNSNLISLLSQRRSLEDGKESIINIERDIYILEINNPTGINPIDLQIARNNIKKKEIALTDLRRGLADYVVRAPFAGTIAQVNSKWGDSVSSGTTLFTLITKQKIAEITLNEIDVAQVKIGQLTTLTFDAVEDVTLTGKVIEIDVLGTGNQGVVTYNRKMAFDTKD